MAQVNVIKEFLEMVDESYFPKFVQKFDGDFFYAAIINNEIIFTDDERIFTENEVDYYKLTEDGVYQLKEVKITEINE